MAGAAAGALIGGAFNIGSGIGQSAFAAAESQAARDHQIKMFKRRYQWTVKDMRAAGLNPALAAMGPGPGSAGPAGPAATGTAPDVAGAAEKGARAGTTTARRKAEVDLLKQQTHTSAQEAMRAGNQGTVAAKEAELLGLGMHSARYRAEADVSPTGQKAHYYGRLGEIMLGTPGSAIGQIGKLLNPFRRLKPARLKFQRKDLRNKK